MLELQPNIKRSLITDAINNNVRFGKLIQSSAKLHKQMKTQSTKPLTHWHNYGAEIYVGLGRTKSYYKLFITRQNKCQPIEPLPKIAKS